MGEPSASRRTIGLAGATSIGVGAIVGGGILLLAGEAFRLTGPGAVLAFACNGIIAVLTAAAFAEMASAVPESGGAYMCAKRVLNVQAAFVVGWVLCSAYVVAGVLYALGFASYLLAGIAELGGPAQWCASREVALGLAVGAVLALAYVSLRSAAGGTQWATWGKVLVLGGLVIAGIVLLFPRPAARIAQGMSPLLPAGVSGMLEAMGYTFIALQGFEVIATVAGEIRRPERTLPWAMMLSLGAALALYIPLLVVAATVGVAPGTTIVQMSEQAPETVMATAVGNYLGPTGFWLVTIAAILATLSALHANVLAASRVAHAMASDRTLPDWLSRRDPARGTPRAAIAGAAIAMSIVIAAVPDLTTAAAAASLVFLVSFALAHATSYLARIRGGTGPREGAMFRAPLFPLVPAVGGTACVALAVYQAVAVPSAAILIGIWMLLGTVAYVAKFGQRATRVDARQEAQDPELARMRGRDPLVLVPVANPANAPGLTELAHALAPPAVGRVLLLVVVPEPTSQHQWVVPSWRDNPVAAAQDVLGHALAATLAAGQRPEALLIVAPSPWEGIRRVARDYRCEALLIGRSRFENGSAEQLEQLMNDTGADVTFLSAPSGWTLAGVRRILVPVGGHGVHSRLLARLLGSMSRAGERTVEYLRVMPSNTVPPQVERARRALREVAEDTTHGDSDLTLLCQDDFVEAVVERATCADLLILGVHRDPRGRRGFGELAPRIAERASCAVLLISSNA